MRKNLLIVLTLALLAPVVAMAQPEFWGPVPDPKVGYLEWFVQPNTRNLPAGTVLDPGSHLTYIVDTGINARKIAGKADLTKVDAAAKTPLAEGSLLQPFLDADEDGNLDDGAIFQNFIAITNTNPTKAVTVHFRYFNDNCEDILDFLVVVTCNDTLLFDPFNFVIPFTGGENSRARLIGPAGSILTPISVVQWGSGRFVITAAASGTTIDLDDQPEILFPFEWRGLADTDDQHCNMNFSEDHTFVHQEIPEVEDGDVPNVGVEGGFSADNLHVFNASQISFNYLIGHLTTAIPKGFIKDTTDVRDQFLAYGTQAWARPAINREISDFPTAADPREGENRTIWTPDGDSYHAFTGQILWGGEPIHTSDAQQEIADISVGTNHAYLRNEVHGGDIESAAIHYPVGVPVGAPVMPAGTDIGDVGGFSLYGALGTTPFASFDTAAQRTAQADNSLIHFLSVADDYNGSNNATNGFGTGDLGLEREHQPGSDHLHHADLRQ